MHISKYVSDLKRRCLTRNAGRSVMAMRMHGAPNRWTVPADVPTAKYPMPGSYAIVDISPGSVSWSRKHSANLFASRKSPVQSGRRECNGGSRSCAFDLDRPTADLSHDMVGSHGPLLEKSASTPHRVCFSTPATLLSLTYGTLWVLMLFSHPTYVLCVYAYMFSLDIVRRPLTARVPSHICAGHCTSSTRLTVQRLDERIRVFFPSFKLTQILFL